MQQITVKAIECGGGATALSKRLGVTRQAVEQWDKVPARHCLAVEEATGISRHELRPDIYGPSSTSPNAKQGSMSSAA